MTQKNRKREDSTVRANGTKARGPGSSPKSDLYKLHDLGKAAILSLRYLTHKLGMLIIILIIKTYT